MNRINTYTKIILTGLVSLMIFACNPVRKVNDGEFLLEKNKIVNKETKIENEEIKNYIKQKPNRKILLVFRFHLWLYNIANEERTKDKRILLNKKHERKNQKRIAKGKKPKEHNRLLFGEWLLNAGEAPVIYDPFMAEKSSKQIKLLANNKGYFNSSVSDSVVFNKRKKTAQVYYTIKSKAPYIINSIDYKITDEVIRSYIISDTAKCLIKPGSRYDVDILQQERDRITKQLNNNGYYLFTKDYIYYEIDSSLRNNQVNITLGVKNFAYKLNDSIQEKPHQRFYIDNIYVQPDFVSKKRDKRDSLIIDGCTFIYSNEIKFKTKVLLNSIFIRKGKIYQLQNVEDTYKRISELRSFKNINIFFTLAAGDSLDCNIQLTPVIKQSFTIETEGTNTGNGYLGLSGSLIYQNKNLLKGAEIFEFRIKGGIEFYKSFNERQADYKSPTSQLSTIEFTPAVNLYVPRFIVPFKVKTGKSTDPKTVFTSSLNYQFQKEYKRYIANISYYYTWRETLKKRHNISPLGMNYVLANVDSSFYNAIKDQGVAYSFTTHMATSIQYTFTYNEQTINKERNFGFFRGSAEFSGNILRGFYDLVNAVDPNTFEKNADGSYLLFGIPYSQYLRFNGDYRYYFIPNDFNQVVLRGVAGIGIPLANFSQLPYERTFWGGGANDIRAWQARTLGPGSYFDTDADRYIQVGDMQLQANVEYRFKLFKNLNSALFLDAGNVWLGKPDPSRPGADFQWNSFYKEFAIGTGTGFRIDFRIFILRLDLGLKLRDPKFPEGQRWVIKNIGNLQWKNEYKQNNYGLVYNFFNLNLAIGYPF